ncbi:YccF domain-containing protein [Luteipulveratus mongoliensis]|uniref:Membrane protein n=1 Tax=Luteipulveratus mongoliensis TaxID=571913 RepID=A0A0K1JKR6_9MICO|nr:YccF domain-containing protein [Luteipulveratus mongoliensis]AKU17296.1 membrane protein [Luteipulveratus mongoliensis]
MRLLLNLIWFVFGGLWLAIGYAFAGLIMCLLIVTIPFGVVSFRIASYVLWPFGRTIVDKPGAGTGSVILNVIWFVLAGWWLALGHILTAVAQAITIIGIPLAIANIKLIPVTLVPFGKDIVPTTAVRQGQRQLHSM